MKFKINQEYRILNPKMSDEDYKNLRENILKEEKILVPIHVLEDGTILCGHNRYNIWKNDLKRNEEEIPYVIVDIKIKDGTGRTSKEVIGYIIRDNIDRRQFSMKERIEQHILLLGIESKKQALADKQTGIKGTDISNFKFSDKNKEELKKHQKIIDYILKNRGRK